MTSISLFRILLRVFALLATLTLAHAQVIQPREALVIGNSDYSFDPLRNPRTDAEAMAKALEEAGFDVTVATDAGQDAMEQAIQTFSGKLKEKGGVGLFYFSGHGAIGETRRRWSTPSRKTVGRRSPPSSRVL